MNINMFILEEEIKQFGRDLSSSFMLFFLLMDAVLFIIRLLVFVGAAFVT